MKGYKRLITHEIRLLIYLHFSLLDWSLIIWSIWYKKV